MPIPGRKRSTGATTAFYRGAEGRARAEEELAKSKAKAAARKEQGNMPFRYRISPGETGEFVILDDAPDFYRFEHAGKNPATGFFDLLTGCCAEYDNCPNCGSGNDPYYALFMSVIDLIPYTNKSNVTTQFARKLLVVKPAQQKKFMRAYDRAMKMYGTMRGVVFQVARDGQMDSAIGNDIEMTDEVIEEDDLQTYVRTWKDREGKSHTENCFEVFDYDALFPPATAEDIALAIGGNNTPGSAAHNDRVLGRTAAPSRRRAAEPDDDEEEAPPRRRGAASSGWKKPGVSDRMPSRRRAVEPEDEEPDDDEEEAPPPRRGSSRRTAAAPAKPPIRRRAGPVDDELDPDDPDYDDGVDVEEEEPAPRASARRNPVRGRRVVEPDEEELDEEPPPRRAAPGVGRRTPVKSRR